MYGPRHLVENFFGKIKPFWVIATRYDKTARKFLSAPRFALFSAVGAAALGVIFGAFVRRWLAWLGRNPFAQSLCAAAIAGVIATIVGRWGLAQSPSLVAFCPCMVLVPGPAHPERRHRSGPHAHRARLTYAAMIVLMICIGVLAGPALGGGMVLAMTDFTWSRRCPSKRRR